VRFEDFFDSIKIQLEHLVDYVEKLFAKMPIAFRCSIFVFDQVLQLMQIHVTATASVAPLFNVFCPVSALVRQNWRLEEGRISGSS
jgi:hypothetical protein